jgi:meiotically up-regulated gene 157 (Mug157) protein
VLHALDVQVDGFGNAYLMDDANVPSLLSLPYLGFCSASDPIYQNTRRFVLSTDNPYYFTSSLGPLAGGAKIVCCVYVVLLHAHHPRSCCAGIGGPHIGRGYIWPMSIIMRVRP